MNPETFSVDEIHDLCEVLRSMVSPEFNYVKSFCGKKNEHLQSKYANLLIGTSKCVHSVITFDLILQDLHEYKTNIFGSMENYKVVQLPNNIINTLRIAEIQLDESMKKWTYSQWAMLILIICYKSKFQNIIKIIINTIYFGKPLQILTNKFINNIQREFDKLIKKTSFLGSFKYKNINFVLNSWIINDYVLHFDVDPNNIWYEMAESLGFRNIDKSFKYNPTITYIDKNKKIALDYNGKGYTSIKYYISHRILIEEDKHRVLSYKDMCYVEYIYWSLKLATSINKQIERRPQIEIINKIRKTGIKLGLNKTSLGLPKICWKKCQICKKILKKHKKYISKCRYDTLKMKFTHKIYFCKCKNLMVCSMKCYKIAWSKKGHREVCIERIERK